MARRKGVNGWEKLGGLSSLEQVSFESGFKDWERVQISEVWEERVPELGKHAPCGAEAGDREVSGGGAGVLGVGGGGRCHAECCVCGSNFCSTIQAQSLLLLLDLKIAGGT